MRGSIVDARKAYPDVLHVEIRDSAGELWRLATQDADWSPSDPQELVGQEIENAEIDESSGELRCKLSNGSALGVRPAFHGAVDDPPNWELIAPDGLVLEFGPGGRWLLDRADEPIAAPDRVREQEFAQIGLREERSSSMQREADSLAMSMLRHAQLRASIAIGASVGSAIAALVALIAALR